MSWRSAIKKAALAVSLGIILNSAYYAAAYVSNLKLREKETVVLSNYQYVPVKGQDIPTPGLTYLIDFFMYGPVVLNENLAGHQVRWVTSATRQEVIDNIANRQHTNIVLIGHGCADSFTAYNGQVTIPDLFLIPKRYEGRLIQYTCGCPTERTLATDLYSDTSECTSFPGWIDPISVYARATGEVSGSLVSRVIELSSGHVY